MSETWKKQSTEVDIQSLETSTEYKMNGCTILKGVNEEIENKDQDTIKIDQIDFNKNRRQTCLNENSN